MDMATGSERNTFETPLLIVGSGPVGLALALDPGWRGVACKLVERTDDLELPYSAAYSFGLFALKVGSIF
jgi:2-polyprenyl-6-methoxyphenol hydroxylase-like FAD-dependent oxidoreductase